MNTFCTIITNDYLPKAAVLYKSLRRFNPDIQLQVLITDIKAGSVNTMPFPNMTLLYLDTLSSNPLTQELYKKYAHTNQDSLRWSLKPILITYLLKTGYSKIIYADCDIFFTNSYDFLFDKLDTSHVLLTPHWRSINPLEENDFLATFTSGIYNAGFIGAARDGIPALEWWASACHYKMGEFTAAGIHDDQKYLDILPVFFENVEIIRHKGCNVAAWNYNECRRTLVNNETLINDRYPVIFIHFNHVLIREILKGHDPLLRSFLEEYKKMYEEENLPLDSFMKELPYYSNAPVIRKIKWRLKIRTRIKRWLFKLAESL